MRGILPPREPQAPEPMDFRKLSRNPKKILTRIILDEHPPKEWIRLGEIHLHTDARGECTLGAYLLDAVDFEHDSAYLLRMHLIGVVFRSVSYGLTRFTGYINPRDQDDFRVGGPDYNPLKGKMTCTRCDKKHPIVQEGFYVPPLNPDLFEAVRGRRIEVITGLPPQEDM